MKAYYYTFGCKVNQYETGNIRELMLSLGYDDTSDPAEAAVCIVNSCTVTAEADSKCRQLLRKLRRTAPDAVIVLAGCYAQAFADEAKALSECDIIVGSRAKRDIPQLVSEFISSRKRTVSIAPYSKGQQIEPMLNLGNDKKTRAYIKIQDGCDQYCTYCMIPLARGHVCSKNPDDIASEAQALVDSGHKELILTGINMCCYGKDIGGVDLADAVRAASTAQGDFRIRLSSLEPELLTDDMIKRLSVDKRLCPHFHLALQSGCDRTLKRMNRHYDTARYAQIVSSLRALFPNCAVTTDIMVGFPDERDDDFAQSLSFVKEMQFSGAHVFAYSRRKGTAADRFAGQLSQEVKNERSRAMREVCDLSAEVYAKSMIGSIVRVLFEKERDDEWHKGYSAEYLNVRVRREGRESLWRTFADVKIISADKNGCIGEITEVL
ncbi:MAG: tRNA (N(6)-L-threonylcarbamoyladenosine(37)-C(2))-methylthiotransferase MtaB [Ruminococcus sp.]|nr:tRNA (N(6)-L-threonylcarbamoyladenosine(37)-C(2))-methylthiotransferase MtaB [Ruminococcus sp.]